jgi:hypothetical protein
VLPAWINRNPADNAFASNGDNPLNFVSHSRGSLHIEAKDVNDGVKPKAAADELRHELQHAAVADVPKKKF